MIITAALNYPNKFFCKPSLLRVDEFMGKYRDISLPTYQCSCPRKTAAKRCQANQVTFFYFTLFPSFA